MIATRPLGGAATARAGILRATTIVETAREMEFIVLFMADMVTVLA